MFDAQREKGLKMKGRTEAKVAKRKVKWNKAERVPHFCKQLGVAEEPGDRKGVKDMLRKQSGCSLAMLPFLFVCVCMYVSWYFLLRISLKIHTDETDCTESENLS